MTETLQFDKEKLTAAIQELHDYGQELRNDWSDFDGRDARDRLDAIASKIWEAQIKGESS